MKNYLPITIITVTLFSTSLVNAARTTVDLQSVITVDLNQPLGQLRAVPVSRGEEASPAILVIYGQDAEIDPYIGMFFFPESTLRMTLFDDRGNTQWARDLGPGVVPGIWFCPVFTFDLNHDGVDEIYFVGNADPAHPMDFRKYQLERVDAHDGKTTKT